MGFKDFMKKLVPKVGKEEESIEVLSENNSEKCAFCQGDNPDKKWLGQMWHNNCLRKAKKMAKKAL